MGLLIGDLTPAFFFFIIGCYYVIKDIKSEMQMFKVLRVLVLVFSVCVA